MEGSITQPDNTTFSITTEYEAPDKYRIVRTGQDVPGSGAKKSEMISVGENTWQRTDDKPWRKVPIKVNAAEAAMGQDALDTLANDKIGTVEFVGTRSLDGVEMKVYHYSYQKKDEDLNETTKGTGDYWVGATDNLPHKLEGESDATGEDGKTEVVKTSVTFDYSASINIVAPM